MPDILLDVGDKTNFKGESNIEGFKDLIVCESFGFGANQPLDLGRGTNRTAGTMSTSEITLSRQFDTSSIPLMNAMFTAKVFKEVKIQFIKAAGVDLAGQAEFLTVTLTDVLLSSVSYGGMSGDSPMTEALSLGYTKIAFAYKVQSETAGTLGGAKTASFDLLTQKSTKG
jgi:type VI secretion system secreted protein Hcp